LNSGAIRYHYGRPCAPPHPHHHYPDDARATGGVSPCASAEAKSLALPILSCADFGLRRFWGAPLLGSMICSGLGVFLHFRILPFGEWAWSGAGGTQYFVHPHNNERQRIGRKA